MHGYNDAPLEVSRFMRESLSKLRVAAGVALSTAWVSLRVLLDSRKSTSHRLMYPRQMWAPSVLKTAGVSVVVTGTENVQPERPCIYIMNHQSNFDVPAVFMALPVPICFVAKAELRKIPIFGHAMDALGMIFIDRSNPERAIESIKAGAALIRGGVNVMAFPEGTRSPDGEIGRFKRGIFTLAMEARVPIVPMAITGSWDVLPPGVTVPRAGEIRIKIGQAIEVEHSEMAELRSEVRDAVVALFDELREQA